MSPQHSTAPVILLPSPDVRLLSAVPITGPFNAARYNVKPVKRPMPVPISFVKYTDIYTHAYITIREVQGFSNPHGSWVRVLMGTGMGHTEGTRDPHPTRHHVPAFVEIKLPRLKSVAFGLRINMIWYTPRLYRIAHRQHPCG
jgi:hypothetical protein